LGSDAVQNNGCARSSAALLVPDSYRASMQRYDRFADRESEPGTLPGGFGGEEGIEKPRPGRLVDSRPGILDLDHDDTLPDLEAVGLANTHVGTHHRQPVPAGADDQGPAGGHGVDGVDHEIHEDLLDLVAVEHGARQALLHLLDREHVRL